jgi:hypothetical protein
MAKRILERRVFIAAMLAIRAPLGGCDGDFVVSVMQRAAAGERLGLHQAVVAEQRHFDIYRNYRAALDAAIPVAVDDDIASAPCYWRGAISD